MKHVSMYAMAGALAVLSFAAAAEDGDFEINWMIRNDGVLVGSPDPGWSEWSPYGQRPFFTPLAKPSDIFSSEKSGQNIRADIQRYFNATTLLPFLLHGGLDLASLADAERHVRKLALGVSEYRLGSTLSVFKMARLKRDKGLPFLPNPPFAVMRSRVLLDPLLAMRVLSGMKLSDDYRREVKTLLADTVADPKEDLLIRDAARQSVALIDGTVPEDVAKNLPPLKDVLGHFSGAPDVLIIAHPHLAPLWGAPAVPAKIVADMQMRQIVTAHPDAITWADLEAARFNQDATGEMPYELARVFGNARWDRVVAAGWLGGGQFQWTVAMNGIFPAEKWAADFKDLGLKQEDGLTAFSALGVSIAFSADTLIISNRNKAADGKAEPSLAEQWDKYAKAGAADNNILWLYLAISGTPGMPLPLAGGFEGLSDITAQIALTRPTMEIRLSAVAESEPQAQAVSVKAAEAIKAMGHAFDLPPFKDSPAVKLAAVFGSATAASNHNSVTATIQFKDLTPEAVFSLWMSPFVVPGTGKN